MRPHEGGAAPARTGTTPVEQPSATSDRSPRRVNHTTGTRIVSVTGTSHRWMRRNRKSRVTLSDVAVWTTFTILTAAVLLALCMILVVIWPTP